MRSLDKNKNIVLIGMPGCGKTSVGKLLSEEMNRAFFDADDVFFEEFGITPADCIIRHGEDEFRKKETEVLKMLSGKRGAVISAGGGAVTRPENKGIIKQNATVIWLLRDLDKLPTEGRPVSENSVITELFEQRRAGYESFSDFSVENNGDISSTVAIILANLSN